MNGSIPKLEFFTDERMRLFWSYVENLLSSVSPMVMIWFAIIAATMLVTIIIRFFRKASSEKNSSDDDYEVREY